jgi:signal transduction histidine kinase
MLHLSIHIQTAIDLKGCLSVENSNEERMQWLEVAFALRASRPLTVGLLLSLALTLPLLLGRIPTAHALTWAFALLTYVFARLAVVAHLANNSGRQSKAQLRQWRRVMKVSGSCVGLIFGSLAVFALPVLSISERVVLTGVVSFFCVWAANHALSSRVAVLATNLCAMVPFAFAWVALPSPYQLAGFVLLAVPLVSSYVSHNQFLFMRDNWEVIVRNELLAEELRRANEELGRLGASRNRLFAVAGHDLRQPVHSMGLALAHINEYDPPQVLRQQIDRLQESSQVISEMLQDLMDISNLERADYQVRQEAVPVAPLLEQLRASQEAAAARKGLDLDILPVPRQLAVMSDANLLRRMLFNLVSNAIKYTLQGSVSVECIASAGEVTIRVTDTGVGIPADQLGAIFDDYVRVAAAHRKDEGLGLGLSVVRRAAEILGHRVSVQSEPGKGSVFSLVVPAASLPEGAPVPARAEVRPEARSERAVRSGNEVIVVIEDDEYVRQALVGLLTQWGFATLAGASAAEALTGLDAAMNVQLIIADLQLSVHESGFDAIESVRHRTGQMDLPAVLLTGDVRPALLPQAAERRIRVAHKPLPPTVLRQIVLAQLEPVGRLGNPA